MIFIMIYYYLDLNNALAQKELSETRILGLFPEGASLIR
jgi:hypothetical protein